MSFKEVVKEVYSTCINIDIILDPEDIIKASKKNRGLRKILREMAGHDPKMLARMAAFKGTHKRNRMDCFFIVPLEDMTFFAENLGKKMEEIDVKKRMEKAMFDESMKSVDS